MINSGVSPNQANAALLTGVQIKLTPCLCCGREREKKAFVCTSCNIKVEARLALDGSRQNMKGIWGDYETLIYEGGDDLTSFQLTVLARWLARGMNMKLRKLSSAERHSLAGKARHLRWEKIAAAAETT